MMKMQSGSEIAEGYNAFVADQIAMALWVLFWMGIALASLLIVVGYRRMRR
jgi:hypothetical protein